MRKRKLKPFVASILYGTVSISLIVSLMFLANKVIKDNTSNINYITSSTITEEVKPVIKETSSNIYVRPYVDSDVIILKNYYDRTTDKTIQENSLIFYENTYIRNKGIDYGRDEVFDIVSVSDGTVTNIENNDILGNIIVIEYEKNITVSYQSIDNITKQIGDIVIKGEKIGTSGISNISKEIGNHIHIEVLDNGVNINPENLFKEGN